MSARHFHQLYYFAILVLHYFISIGFQAGGSCILGRKTCMSAQHFHRSAGPFTILPFFYFPILLLHFHWVPGRRFLHLGPQNLHVGPAFSPVGRTVYYSTVLLFSYFTIAFPLGSRQEVLASWAAKPACRPATFTGRHLPELFCISGRQPCMSAHVFCMSGHPILHVRRTLASPRAFLHLGPPILHVDSRFCLSAKCIPLSYGQERAHPDYKAY